MNEIETDRESVIDARAVALRDEQLHARRVRVDRMFVWLFLVQWVGGIIAALTGEKGVSGCDPVTLAILCHMVSCSLAGRPH